MRFDRLLAAKSSTFPAIQSATEVILNVINEIATHKTFCATFGVSAEELENTPESTATTAYGAYILNVGIQGEILLRHRVDHSSFSIYS